jgi:hypothetical protein
MDREMDPLRLLPLARSPTMQRVFDRVFIIMFENELESAVLRDDYVRGLQGRGVRLGDDHGVTHPSQPNYAATVTGLPFVDDDTCQDIEIARGDLHAGVPFGVTCA